MALFGYDNKGNIYILRVPKEKNEKKVHLLLIKDKYANTHCLVKNISRLLTSQVSKHKEKRYFCNYCLNSFDNKKIYRKSYGVL